MSYPFKVGKAWAGDLYTVIPGTRIEKSPMCKWKHLVKPARNLPTTEEAIRFRTLGITEGANPLLLLDCPVSTDYDLCIVDVDHASADPEIREWFASLGITKTLFVKSGRGEEGVGHYYFLREKGKSERYHSGPIPAFGKFTKADGKDSCRVDFKAYNSYAVAPGAVHKSGRAYTAWWGEEPVASLEDILHLLPVMPVEAWLEKKGVKEVGAAPDSQWVVKGAEWEAVVLDGRDRQPCPWCKRGGDRILSYNATAGTAHCYYEKTTRKLCLTLPENGMSIVDAVLRDLPDGSDTEDTKIYAKHWAGFMLEQSAAPVHISFEDIPVLEEDSPLKGTEVKLGLASLMLQSRYGSESGQWISCSKAPVVCTGFGSSTSGGYAELRTTCRNLNCPDCGPHILEALRASTLGEAIELTFGALTPEDCALVGLYPYNKAYARATGARFWSATLRRPSAGHKNLAEQFRRHEESTGGAFQWLGVQVTPAEVSYVFFFDVKGGGLPREDSSLYYLFDQETPEPMPFDQAVQALFSQVDLDAWAHSVAIGETKRIKLLLGPSKLTERIQATFEWLTGRTRNAAKKRELSPDSNRFSVATYKPSEVRKVIEDGLCETIVMDAPPSASRQWGGGTRMASLSTTPGPILKEAVASGLLESTSGHRKSKRISLADVDNLLNEM